MAQKKEQPLKDFTKRELNDSRPEKTLKEVVDFCLKKIYEDKKHKISDEVSPGLTYEELIGALLLAQDTEKELSD